MYKEISLKLSYFRSNVYVILYLISIWWHIDSNKQGGLEVREVILL